MSEYECAFVSVCLRASVRLFTRLCVLAYVCACEKLCLKFIEELVRVNFRIHLALAYEKDRERRDGKKGRKKTPPRPPSSAITRRMLPCTVVCCHLLPYVAMCHRMLPFAAVCCHVLSYVGICRPMLPFATVCCHMPSYVAIYRPMLPCSTACLQVTEGVCGRVTPQLSKELHLTDWYQNRVSVPST